MLTLYWCPHQDLKATGAPKNYYFATNSNEDLLEYQILAMYTNEFNDNTLSKTVAHFFFHFFYCFACRMRNKIGRLCLTKNRKKMQSWPYLRVQLNEYETDPYFL